MLRKSLALLILSITSLIIFFSISHKTISERFNDLNKEITTLAKETSTCVSAMQSKHKKYKDLSDCEPIMQLRKNDLARFRKRLEKQLTRYKEQKEKLSLKEHELIKEQTLNIKNNAVIFKNNLYIILDKR